MCSSVQPNIPDPRLLAGVHESADTLTTQRLAAGFAARGHIFVALEQHGHGRSSGQRGLVQSFDLLVAHASDFVEHLLNADPSARVVVLGHSLGGAVTAFLGAPMRRKYASRFLGTILLAPSLSGPTPDWLTRTALSGLANIWSGAPVGPPEHPDEYETGSGLGLNYCGKMQVRSGS